MDNLVLEKALKKAVISAYKIIWSFTLGIIINNITKTNTVLKVPMGEYYINIMENHSSFQYSLSIRNFVYLLVMTLTLNFIGWNKINKKFVNKIIFYEFLLFLFLEGLNTDSLNMEEIIKFIVALMIVLTIGFFYMYLIEDDEISKNSNDKYLFPERKLDLERIEETLNISNVLGIDSEWGQGKTFIIDHLKVNKRNREVINLSILSLSEEDVFVNIINQLDSILYKNKTFGFHSKKLKKIICNQSVFGLNFTTMFNNQSKKEAIEDYVKNFEILKKEVVIVFDDLDRINDKEKIIKVFEFGELFKTKYIKIIYLFSQNQITKFGYSQIYIEKFIPIIYKLTELPFEKILRMKIEEISELKEFIKIEDFYFIIRILKNKFYEYNPQTDDELNTFKFHIKWTKKDAYVNNLLDKMSIREIENFLLEVLINLKTLKRLKVDIENRLIISFLFIKKFYRIDFEKFISLKQTFPIICNIKLEGINSRGYYSENIDIEDFYLIKNLESKIICENNMIKTINGYLNKEELEEKIQKFGLTLREENIDGRKEYTIIENNFIEIVIDDKFIQNMYIHSLFDYPIRLECKDLNLIEERRMKIDYFIKKIVYMGNKKVQTNYEFIYKKLVPILEKNNIEERRSELYFLLDNNREDDEYREFNYDRDAHIPRMIEYFGKNVDNLMIRYLEVCLYGNELFNEMILRINNEFVLKKFKYRKVIYNGIIEKKKIGELEKNQIRKFLLNLGKTISFEYNLIIFYFFQQNSLEDNEKILFNYLNGLLKQLKNSPLNEYIIEEIRLYYRCYSKLEKIYRNEAILEKKEEIQIEMKSKESEKTSKIINEIKDLDSEKIKKILKKMLDKEEITARELKYILKKVSL